MSKLTKRLLAVLFTACLLQGICIPILATGGTGNDLVIDFEDETIGLSPKNSAITAVDVSGENTVTVVADPDDADNKVIKIDRKSMTTRPRILVKFPEQSGAFTVEYRIMFGEDAQYAAVLQSGTDGDKEAVYLLARDQSYVSNPGELLNHNGTDWNTLFGKSEFKYNEWYSVKIDMDLEGYKYDIAVTDQSGVTRTSAKASLKSAGITCLDYLNFQTAGSNTATLYVDSIKISGEVQDGGGSESSDMPKTPDVAFDFETDVVGKEPTCVEISGMTSLSSIKVVADPSVSGGKAVLMSDADEASAALKVTAPFAEKTDTVTMAFKMMFGDKTGDYIVNVLREEDEGVCGPRLLARAGSLRYINGSGNWVTFNADYATDTWYSFVIVANISNHTYSLYADGVEIVKDAAFETDVDKISKLQFTTTRALNGELYLDDIAVEDPIMSEPEINVVEKYTPGYRGEQLLADGDGSAYLAFPSILKLSEEKVLIVYKWSTAHADVEADLELLVYNPTTRKVVNRTVIDATVGEAAQNPELIKMPNGDLVVYLDVQRTSDNGQIRYGIKEIRSTDGGITWNVLTRDGTYMPAGQVKKGEYKVLKDDKDIVYGYVFDEVTIGNDVYMLAMSFPDFASDPGRSVHVIKSSDNGATWNHVRNLTATFGLSFNESTFEACDGGFIINCRTDANGGKGITFRTDESFNVLKKEDYSDYSDILKTTQRPKMFVENGRYYLMGRNILDGETSLGLYEFDPVTLLPLNYIELKNLSGKDSGNSFYAEYYLHQRNGVTYFNVITYDDERYPLHPDIVRYEFAWEELLTQTSVVPKWDGDAIRTENKTTTSADVIFKAPSDDRFVQKYTIYLNGEIVETIDFKNIKEEIGSLPGAKVNYSGQGEFYIAMPENIPEGMKLPVIIAVHGSGRGAMDYKNTPFYAEQKNIALANGYIFAAVSNGPDTWGLDDGLFNLNLFYDYLIANYPVQEKAALWATSAGGTLANRMVKDYPEKVSFVLETFPVYDLVSGFELNSCKSAWGTSASEAFKALIAGKNPAEFPTYLKNTDYYITHGDSDTAVPLKDHSQRMALEVGSNIHLEIIEGGVHGTDNYAFYGDMIELAFAEHPATYVYTLTGLMSGTDYMVSINASDADGYDSAAKAVSFKTLPDAENPGNSDTDTTEKPTEAPTEKPTEAPTDEPTEAPTEKPTEAPTDEPTEKPTEVPTEAPTDEPTEKPTEAPTEIPTDEPTEKPTEAPTETPTDKPTEKPTDAPTEAPTVEPTDDPTSVNKSGCGSAVSSGVGVGVVAVILLLGSAYVFKKE